MANPSTARSKERLTLCRCHEVEMTAFTLRPLDPEAAAARLRLPGLHASLRISSSSTPMKLHQSALIAMLIGCVASTPVPGVMEVRSSDEVEAIPGPMPGTGPFKSIDEALIAACSVIVRQPNAVIPVPEDHQNFSVYWRVSSEYCAWLYSGNGSDLELSWLAFNPVQVDPTRRTCKLPPTVTDPRHAPERIAHLVILHNHPYQRNLDVEDLVILAKMSRLHGATIAFAEQQIPISVVAFFGRHREGHPECAGYHRYTPLQNAHIFLHTADLEGRWTSRVAGKVLWPADGSDPVVQAVKP